MNGPMSRPHPQIYDCLARWRSLSQQAIKDVCVTEITQDRSTESFWFLDAMTHPGHTKY